MSCSSIDCGFSCNKTPLQITGSSDISDLSGVQQQLPTGNGNATARLWAIIPGTGLLSHPTDGSSGVLIGEQIQDTFTFYGVSYTLIDVRLFYGQHVLFPLTDVSGQCNVTHIVQNNRYTAAPLEVYCFFKDTMNNILCLVLPIGIADGTSNAATYLSALSITAGSPQPPPLSTLFGDLAGANSSAFNAKNLVLHYTGQDIRTYTSSSICDPTSLHSPVQYLFIMNDINGTKKISSTISMTIYNELITKLTSSLNIDYLQLTYNTPVSITGISSNDIYKLRFLPPNALYITSNVGGANTISVNSLKCYPMNPKQNIKDKQLYLDEKGRPTNIQCPSNNFTVFMGNNNQYYCCNGTVTNNKCSTTDPDNFCGLDNNPVDPITRNPISSCETLKRKILYPPSTLSNNFWSSAAGIETILAIIIGLTVGGVFLYFMRESFFSSIVRPAGAAAAGAAAAAPAAAAAAAKVVTAAAVAAKVATAGAPATSWWTPPGGSWWNIIPIGLLIGFIILFILFITFLSLYLTK